MSSLSFSFTQLEWLNQPSQLFSTVAKVKENGYFPIANEQYS
jgi:hypothetical protein